MILHKHTNDKKKKKKEKAIIIIVMAQRGIRSDSKLGQTLITLPQEGWGKSIKEQIELFHNIVARYTWVSLRNFPETRNMDFVKCMAKSPAVAVTQWRFMCLLYQRCLDCWEIEKIYKPGDTAHQSDDDVAHLMSMLYDMSVKKQLYTTGKYSCVDAFVDKMYIVYSDMDKSFVDDEICDKIEQINI